MERRKFLMGSSALGITGLAGCSEMLGQEATTEATVTQTEAETETETAQEEQRNFEPEFLLNAFRIELLLNDIQVDKVAQPEGHARLDYLSSGISGEEDNVTTSIYSEALTICEIFYSELLIQGFETELLQVWAEYQDSDEVDVYNVRPQWVRDWADRKLTDAQLLAHIDETVQNPAN